MGNLNLSKRQVRQEYKDAFQMVINDHWYGDASGRSTYVGTVRPGGGAAAAAAGDGGAAAGGTAAPSKAIRNAPSTAKVSVHVRKRPIFQAEIDAGEFDILKCENPRIQVADCRIHADMKRKYIVFKSFPFQNVFSERCNNEEVYRCTTAPLVAHAVRGGMATCFMFGQTGSGKTYTMQGLQQFAAQDLFRDLPAGVAVNVSIFEITGIACADLLNNQEVVTMLEDAEGNTIMKGAQYVPVTNARQLMRQFDIAAALRSSSSTEKNDQSSRSHSICRIDLTPLDNPEVLYGRLTLVDLAGSERSADSLYHDAEQRKQGAYINASLMALKNCIRLRALNETSDKPVRVPYRDNKLTRIMKECFTNDDAMTAVIATVAPNATDTEHTVCTLQHVGLMKCEESDVTEETVDIAIAPVSVPTVPAKWTAEQVATFLNTAKRGVFRPYMAAFAGMDGKTLTRLAAKRMGQMMNNEDMGALLWGALRDEITRVNDDLEARRERQRQLLAGNILSGKENDETKASSSSAPARRQSVGSSAKSLSRASSSSSVGGASSGAARRKSLNAPSVDDVREESPRVVRDESPRVMREMPTQATVISSAGTGQPILRVPAGDRPPRKAVPKGVEAPPAVTRVRVSSRQRMV